MRENILNIIAKVTKIDVNELKNKMDEEKIWDSLVHIELIISLEKEFSITFDIEELFELTTVSKIIGMIERKIA